MSRLSEVREKGELIREEYLAEGVAVEAYVPTELFMRISKSLNKKKKKKEEKW